MHTLFCYVIENDIVTNKVIKFDNKLLEDLVALTTYVNKMCGYSHIHNTVFNESFTKAYIIINSTKYIVININNKLKLVYRNQLKQLKKKYNTSTFYHEDLPINSLHDLHRQICYYLTYDILINVIISKDIKKPFVMKSNSTVLDLMQSIRDKMDIHIDHQILINYGIILKKTDTLLNKSLIYLKIDMHQYNKYIAKLNNFNKYIQDYSSSKPLNNIEVNCPFKYRSIIYVRAFSICYNLYIEYKFLVDIRKTVHFLKNLINEYICSNFISDDMLNKDDQPISLLIFYGNIINITSSNIIPIYYNYNDKKYSDVVNINEPIKYFLNRINKQDYLVLDVNTYCVLNINTYFNFNSSITPHIILFKD